MRALIVAAIVLSLSNIAILEAVAATIELSPASTMDCNEEFEHVANALRPGDELMLHGGTYLQSCWRAITGSEYSLWQ